MAPSDFEANVYDLGTTSVRLVRVANVVELVYSNKLEAKIIYAELSSRFNSAQDRLGSGLL
jgi:hypothetical protein